jgi:hypothetical protein
MAANESSLTGSAGESRHSTPPFLIEITAASLRLQRTAALHLEEAGLCDRLRNGRYYSISSQPAEEHFWLPPSASRHVINGCARRELYREPDRFQAALTKNDQVLLT